MKLLHISDLHFRVGEAGTNLDPFRAIRNAILRDAQDMVDALGPIDGVLVSGDLAYSGHPEEYTFARQWLEELCRLCSVDIKHVFVIPGNHDVNRTVANQPDVRAMHEQIVASDSINYENVVRGMLTHERTARVLYEPLDAYNAFAAQFLCDLLPPERTIAKRDLFLNDGSILRLVGFNSALTSSAADSEGRLHVDPACFQLERIRGVEYLVLCHHPFHWLRDRGTALRDHLDDVAKIQLFGHDHTLRVDVRRDSIRVAASAAHPDRREPNWKPGYNLIELEVDGLGVTRSLKVAVHARVWQHTPGRFVSHEDVNGDSVFRHTFPLDSWVAPQADPVEAYDPETEQLSQSKDQDSVPVRSDPMDDLRDIGVKFFNLNVNDKFEITGKLGLLEEGDARLPDFERFRRAFLRAQERELLGQLKHEIDAVVSMND